MLIVCFFIQVVISECSGAVGKFREKTVSINPQKTHLFKFGIHAYGMKGGNNYCIGKEYGQCSIYLLHILLIAYSNLFCIILFAPIVKGMDDTKRLANMMSHMIVIYPFSKL